MNENMEQRVFKTIAQVSDCKINTINNQTTFDDLGLTSLDAVTIAYELELEFGITIPDSEVYSIRSVQELIDGVQQLTSQGTTA